MDGQQVYGFDGYIHRWKNVDKQEDSKIDTAEGWPQVTCFSLGIKGLRESRHVMKS